MEGSSPEDLSVGPSVINRSRTIHMEGRTLKRSGQISLIHSRSELRDQIDPIPTCEIVLRHMY